MESFTRVKGIALSSWGRSDALQVGVGIIGVASDLLLALVWDGIHLECGTLVRRGRSYGTDGDVCDADDVDVVVMYVMCIEDVVKL